MFYGGGHLARDLTLPRLREQWPDTPDAARAAVAEWGFFYRVLELAVAHEPVRYRDLIANPKPGTATAAHDSWPAPEP